MIRAGANREQQNRIKRMANDGMGSKEIAKILKMHESVVKSFMDWDHAEWEKRQALLVKQQREIAVEKQIAAEAGARVAMEKASKKGG